MGAAALKNIYHAVLPVPIGGGGFWWANLEAECIASIPVGTEAANDYSESYSCI